MNTLRIQLSGALKKTALGVTVDGVPVPCKRKGPVFEATVQTPRADAEICVFRHLELRERGWFWFALLSYLLGVFGIFSPAYDRKCLVPDVRLRVLLGAETGVAIRLNPALAQRRAAEITAHTSYMELGNVYLVDRVAKRRRRVLLACKLLSWAAIAALAVWLLVRGF